MIPGNTRKTPRDFVSNEISSQRNYVWSYVWVAMILLGTYLIERNRVHHQVDQNYWIKFLEPIFDVNFADRGMNVAILAIGYTLAIFVFTTSALIKRSRLEKQELQKQIGIQQARDDLLALASHQLRTPATGVKQYLGIFLEQMAGEVTDVQKKIIQKAYDNNERQLHIINDFLYMAKLNNGRIVLHPAKTNIQEIVQEIIDAYSYNMQEKEISYTNSLESLIIKTDKQCLRMAIENLISNAIKYTLEGGSLHISTRTDRQYAYIAVSDTGVGVPRKSRKYLFSKFTRIDNPLTTQEDGTGIGLYIANTLMELNGGSISYDATKQGSVFTIKLPHIL